MPVYEYECASCGKHTEAMQKITDQPLAECPHCRGELRKLISSTSFVLKGGGWYADGYSSSSANGGNDGSEKPAKKEDTVKKDTVSPGKEPAKETKSEGKAASSGE